jgi:hypothetical protein
VFADADDAFAALPPVAARLHAFKAAHPAAYERAYVADSAAALFAPQAAGWVDGGTAVLSLVQYIMYDYDYDAQAQQYPFLAAVFFVAFMLLITNLVLWMVLAIVFEEYSAVRVAAHALPSVADEAAAGERKALAAAAPNAGITDESKVSGTGLEVEVEERLAVLPELLLSESSLCNSMGEGG